MLETFSGFLALLHVLPLPLLLNPLKGAKPFLAHWLWAVPRPQVAHSVLDHAPPQLPLVVEVRAPMDAPPSDSAVCPLHLPALTSSHSPMLTPSWPHGNTGCLTGPQTCRSDSAPGPLHKLCPPCGMLFSLGTSVAPPSPSQSFAEVSGLSQSPSLRLHDTPPTHTHTHTQNMSSSRIDIFNALCLARPDCLSST